MTHTVPRITNLQLRILALIEDDYRGVGPIADELDVSERIVKRSIGSLGRKLGCPIPRMPAKAREMGVRF